ncbi:MAG: TonB-dependent receptor [Proteobacteria bacterium]|nr:TonB-dependent receptor [Pseudomonadota bacterium]
MGESTVATICPAVRPRLRGRSKFIRLPLAAAIHIACFSGAHAVEDADQVPQQSSAQQTAEKTTASLGEVTVTAQKRTENAQAVPLSIDVLSTDKLSEMNVNGLTDYVKMLPSVSIQSASPGFSQVFMRGVTSGSVGNNGVANHSASMPSVGIYLDEQPITTIQGALDLHIYDIQRVEALAGPQGTLYGASSQSGTIRIITNKPDPSAFAASVSTEINSISHGTMGYTVEGFVNVPLRENLALRVVGWNEHDAGYIDNVLGSRTYPTSGITADNKSRVHDAYNESWLKGARAALKLDLNDDWSITPTVMGQSQHNGGVYSFDPKIGDLKVSHGYPEWQEDRWVQSALTVQGKIGNFDLVYAYSHLNRSDWADQDYADYSFWYDTLAGYGKYLTDNNGNYINPGQHIHNEDIYSKSSHELRIASPKDERLRFVGGFFGERQSHRIFQNYQITGLATATSVTGWPGTFWLTKQHRVDEDYAVFGEASYDITDQLTATLGARFFHTENSLRGFFGWSTGYNSSQGEGICFSDYKFDGAPCTDVDQTTKQNDHVGKANLTYKFDKDKMIYATWSEGFRPGGINRRPGLAPYQADFLTNYEFGWKTEWLDHRLRWNGAVFQENWKDFQFAILGANGLTEIKNANQARIRGLETNLTWAATYNLTLSAGFTYLNSVLTSNYCGQTKPNGDPISSADCTDPSRPDLVPSTPLAPTGTRLPTAAKQKGNLSARYVFDAFGGEGYFQAAGFFEGRRRTDLRVAQNNLIGDMPGYASIDLSTGLKKDAWMFDVYLKNVFDSRGEINRYTECDISHCVQPRGDSNYGIFGQYYITPIQPRTIGLRVTRNFD